MGEIESFTETAAIADGIGQRQVQRERRHDEHREEQQHRRYATVGTEKEINAQYQFIYPQAHGNEEGYGQCKVEVKGFEVLSYLQRCTGRID